MFVKVALDAQLQVFRLLGLEIFIVQHARVDTFELVLGWAVEAQSVGSVNRDPFLKLVVEGYFWRKSAEVAPAFARRQRLLLQPVGYVIVPAGDQHEEPVVQDLEIVGYVEAGIPVDVVVVFRPGRLHQRFASHRELVRRSADPSFVDIPGREAHPLAVDDAVIT